MSKLEDKKFTHALYTSMLLHVVAIVIFYFGLPTFHQKLPDEQQVFTFEMLPASAIPNVKTQNTKKKGRVEKKAKKIKRARRMASSDSSAAADDDDNAFASPIKPEPPCIERFVHFSYYSYL